MELKDIGGLSADQQAAIEKLLQSEGDRIRTKYSNELKEVKAELSKYKPVEKTDAEKALDEKLKEIEKREQEISAKEKSIEVSKKLKEAGLPEGLASFLYVGDDVDKTIESVGQTINTYFLNHGSKPTNHGKAQSITKEDFRKMSYGQRANLLAENPELYHILAN